MEVVVLEEVGPPRRRHQPRLQCQVGVPLELLGVPLYLVGVPLYLVGVPLSECLAGPQVEEVLAPRLR